MPISIPPAERRRFKGLDMAHKTKAAIQGRQRNQTEINQRQITRLTAGGRNQPFGSMPRDCSSFLRIRFIQVARDESPSCFATSSSCARNSSGKRIWYCGDLFSCCVDMVVTGAYYHLHGNDHCNYSYHKKQRPVVLGTHTGRLTKNVIRGNDHG